MGKQKTNPNKQPKTQADVDKAYLRGLTEGAQNSLVLFLWTMVDAFHATPEQIQTFEKELAYNMDSVKKKTTSIYQLNKALIEEYNLHMIF